MNARRKMFFILFLVVLGTGFIAVLWGYYQMFEEVSQAEGSEMEQLWEKGLLNEIIELAAEKLQTNSLNFALLRYSGYAYFYLALSQIDEGERKRNLVLAVRHLRKAIVAGNPGNKVRAEIYYILGKSYFYSGLPNMPLCVEYLQKSIELGYSAKDTFEFLADAYRRLGEEQKSLDYFESLYQQGKRSARFLLSYGQSLLKAQVNERAEAILKNAQKNSQNQLLLAEILLQLGQVYYNMGRWQDARLSLEQTLEKRESAKAHFLLGEVYRALGEPIRARREWRLTLELDEQYTAALERLQE